MPPESVWEIRGQAHTAIPHGKERTDVSLSRGFSLRELFKTMGMKSVLVSMLMFLLTVTVTCIVGFQFYRTTKDNIHLQGRVNAVQSAKELDGYILVRKNTVILAGHVVDEMIREGKSNKEILDYLSAE